MRTNISSSFFNILLIMTFEYQLSLNNIVFLSKRKRKVPLKKILKAMELLLKGEEQKLHLLSSS